MQPRYLLSALYGKKWPIEENIVYVFDKGYYDYDWWWSINEKNAYFVSKLKVNAAIQIQQQFEVEKNSSILEDGLFVFSNPKPRAGKKICILLLLGEFVLNVNEKNLLFSLPIS